MRLERLIRCVMDEPWLIRARNHYNIQNLLKMKLEMSTKEFQSRQREGEDFSGSKVKLDSMTIEDGVARIPFAGVLVKGADAFERGSGALSHGDVEADVAEALDDEDVKAIFFDTDSPGGTAAGSYELSDIIAKASTQKPTMAWVERLCCSGAFLSLCGCTMIYGSESSEIGAVECYMAWVDASVAFEKEGLKVVLIKNTGGTHVAAGLPGHPLTDEQEEQLQKQVDQLFDMYVQRVESNRPQVKRSSMSGATFIGDAGVRAGMFDSITSKTRALADLRLYAKID